MEPLRPLLDPASFRDPSGNVFEFEGRIYRSIFSAASADYRYARDSGFLDKWYSAGHFLPANEIHAPELKKEIGCEFLVEHPRLEYVSYPYEWCFGMLKAAALLHLDLQLDALNYGLSFSDSTAYNVQFQGVQPIFIDLLSLRRYRDGEYWVGHGQFCEQFLNPLLLWAHIGVAHNAWFRGSLEGIPSTDLNRMLPLRSRLSWRVLTHVAALAQFQNAALRNRERAANRVKRRKLSKLGYQGILEQLRAWIARLRPKNGGNSVWGDYASTHTYDDAEMLAKREFVDEFIRHTAPRSVADVGCNVGEFAELALNSGAKHVVGFEYDWVALERAFERAASKQLNLTPLYLDAANPSPDQGWRQRERKGFQARVSFDAVLALAFEHHLAIGRNIPLDDVVEWLTALAPRGVIEFVHKDDPTIQQMLDLRDDIFANYSQANFEASLRRRARIVKSKAISVSGRHLYWFDRS